MGRLQRTITVTVLLYLFFAVAQLSKGFYVASGTEPSPLLFIAIYLTLLVVGAAIYVWRT